MKTIGWRLLAVAVLLAALLIIEAQARDETIERLRLGSGFEVVIGQKQIEPEGPLLEALAIWVGAKLGQSVPAA